MDRGSSPSVLSWIGNVQPPLILIDHSSYVTVLIMVTLVIIETKDDSRRTMTNREQIMIAGCCHPIEKLYGISEAIQQ